MDELGSQSSTAEIDVRINLGGSFVLTITRR